MINYNSEFLNKICNWGKSKNYIFSIDVDFVPDYILSDTIKLFEESRVKSTIFLTHDTILLNILKKNDNFEIGIHPNINVGSTQKGDNNYQKIKILSNSLNNPRSNKFHLLHYNFRDLNLLRDNGIKFDCSMLYYGTPYLLPTYHVDSDLILAPYYWEDGHSHQMGKTIKFNMVNMKSPGLKIFNFHPIDLYYNTLNINHRNEVKNVNKITDKITGHLKNTKYYGVRNYFLDVVDYIKINNHNTIFCDDLNQQARKNIIKYE